MYPRAWSPADRNRGLIMDMRADGRRATRRRGRDRPNADWILPILGRHASQGSVTAVSGNERIRKCIGSSIWNTAMTVDVRIRRHRRGFPSSKWNSATRRAALPEFPATTMNRPRSSFSRHPVLKAARSIGRSRTRIPTAFREFTTPSDPEAAGRLDPPPRGHLRPTGRGGSRHTMGIHPRRRTPGSHRAGGSGR
jgi:hypothetical protein